MIALPETARKEWPCPLARTFGSQSVDTHCRAEGCPVWRWMPLSAEDPAFMEAVAQEIKKAGGGALSHKAAVKQVMENREALGLPTKPTHGFCGLGGKP